MKANIIVLLFFISYIAFSQDMIRVNVSSDPSGASFTFEGSNNVMTTPFSMKFSKSLTYSITFSKPGYESKTISYRGGSGDIFVKLDREHKQDPPQEDMVRVNINSNPQGATFVLTGSNNTMSTPNTMKFSRSLTYQITFSKPGYSSKTISYRGGSGDIFVNLEKDISTYSLSVKSNVNRAVVFINGQQYGNTPLNANLNEGNYNIAVKANGYRDFVTSINLNSNQNIFANLELNQLTLSINSNVQGALVFINGQQAGNIPYKANLNPGTYNLQVKAQGYKTFASSVNLNSDQNVYANLETEKVINIKVPFGAKIYINNKLQKTDWGNQRNGRNDRDTWKTFTFFGDTNSSRYSVKVVYYDLETEESVEFNGGTLTLFSDLR